MGFEIKDNVLVKYTEEGVTKVVIPEGVTKIGKSAFHGCRNLTSITMPDSVTEIGDSAFYDCSRLTSIALSNNITEIGRDAFGSCSRLKTILMSDNVKKIGDYAFHRCYGLATITIADSITKIGQGAFWGCRNLKSISIHGKPDFDESIFNKDTLKSLEYIALKNMPVTIWKTASLRRMSILGFADYYYNGEAIPADVLAENTKYIKGQKKKIFDLIPKSKGVLKFMLDNKMIDIDDVEKFLALVDDVEMKSMLLNYYDSKFSEKEKNVHFEKQFDMKPLSVAELKKAWAYEENSKGEITIRYYKGYEKDISVPDSVGGKPVVDISSNAFSPDRKGVSKDYKEILKTISSVVLPKGLRKISDGIFKNCSGLKSVIISESVNEIGFEAFKGCLNLTSVKIPKKVKKIDQEAFSGCLNLETILIPEGIRKIGPNAFDKTKWLKKQPDWVMANSRFLHKYKGNNEHIVIPNNVAIIGERAFRDCTSLTSITIPDSVTEIGEWAFDGCSSLTSITIPNGVTKIGDEAFYGCSNLTSITIPDGVTEISKRAFCGCSNLTSITIPDSVTKIGYRAFKGCSSLTSITIPDRVTKIDENAFSECPYLIITAPAGSYAIEYAKKYNIKYKEE